MTTRLTFQVSANLAKLQIIDDIRHGIVPAPVPSYSELHDFVDANEYGFAFSDRLTDLSPAFLSDEDIDQYETLYWQDTDQLTADDRKRIQHYEQHYQTLNAMSDHVDAWIKQGRHRRYLSSDIDRKYIWSESKLAMHGRHLEMLKTGFWR